MFQYILRILRKNFSAQYINKYFITTVKYMSKLHPFTIHIINCEFIHILTCAENCMLFARRLYQKHIDQYITVEVRDHPTALLVTRHVCDIHTIDRYFLCFCHQTRRVFLTSRRLSVCLLAFCQLQNLAHVIFQSYNCRISTSNKIPRRPLYNVNMYTDVEFTHQKIHFY